MIVPGGTTDRSHTMHAVAHLRSSSSDNGPPLSPSYRGAPVISTS